MVCVFITNWTQQANHWKYFPSTPLGICSLSFDLYFQIYPYCSAKNVVTYTTPWMVYMITFFYNDKQMAEFITYTAGGPNVSFVNNQFNFWSVYCVVLCCVVNKVLTIFVKKVKLLFAVNRTYKQWNKLEDHLEGFIKHKKLLDDYTSAFLFRYS